MFDKEATTFIKTLLEDELARIITKKCKIDDYNKLKQYNELVKEREDYIRQLLSKYKKEFCSPDLNTRMQHFRK